MPPIPPRPSLPRLPSLAQLQSRAQAPVKTPPQKKTGLRKNQLLFMEVLYRARGPLTRKQLCDRTGCHPTNVTANALGRVGEEERRRRDEANGYPCLLTLKYVDFEPLDIEGKEEAVYFLTPEGRRAYEELTGEQEENQD